MVRHARSAGQVPDDLNALLLFETARRVQKDRTVSLHGVVYEVDAALVGEKITLRDDPAAPARRSLARAPPYPGCQAARYLRQLLREAPSPVVRSGPQKLDSPVSGVFLAFQAANWRFACS